MRCALGPLRRLSTASASAPLRGSRLGPGRSQRPALRFTSSELSFILVGLSALGSFKVYLSSRVEAQLARDVDGLGHRMDLHQVKLDDLARDVAGFNNRMDVLQGKLEELAHSRPHYRRD